MDFNEVAKHLDKYNINVMDVVAPNGIVIVGRNASDFLNTDVIWKVTYYVRGTNGQFFSEKGTNEVAKNVAYIPAP